LNGRVGRLEERIEALIPPPRDEAAELRREITIAILDEIGRLKSLRGHGIFRSGEPNIPPFDLAGETLGYPYTHGEFIEFAIRHVVEGIREDQPDLFDDEGWEGLVAKWTQSFKESHEAQLGSRDAERFGWDKVAQTGPPSPKST
jgi:hypothetical protein